MGFGHVDRADDDFFPLERSGEIPAWWGADRGWLQAADSIFQRLNCFERTGVALNLFTVNSARRLCRNFRIFSSRVGTATATASSIQNQPLIELVRCKPVMVNGGERVFFVPGVTVLFGNLVELL